MKPSFKIITGLKKATGVSDFEIKLIVRDFIKATSKHKKKIPQSVVDAAFNFFLAGNLNATAHNTCFGKYMSPFLREK